MKSVKRILRILGLVLNVLTMLAAMAALGLFIAVSTTGGTMSVIGGYIAVSRLARASSACQIVNSLSVSPLHRCQ